MAVPHGRSTWSLDIDFVTASDPAIPTQRLAEEMETLEALPEPIRAWFAAHRIPPRVASLARNSDGTDMTDVWLVTDHTGDNDSPYRVYFDESKNRFGRECLLDNGVPLLLGVHPSLLDVLDEIL